MSFGGSIIKHVGCGRAAGDQQDTAGGQSLPQAQRRFDTIQPREKYVEDRHVRWVLARFKQCSLAAVNRSGSKAMMLQDKNQSLADRPVIVYH